MTGKADLEQLLGYIVDASIARTGAERGLLLIARKDGELDVRVARQRGGEEIVGKPRFSTSAVKRVLETRQPRKDMFNSSGDGGDLAASVVDLKLRALMCVPLEVGEGERALRGALYVDSRAATREFDARDLSYFSALGVQISVALKSAASHVESLERARLERSLEIAKAVQSNLMPQVPRDVPGLDVFGWYRAAERTSGDFYDFFKTRDGRLAVMVGDVTGHGPGSALITSQAQASLRASIRILPDLCEAVTEVNADISGRMDDGNFVTLFVALIAPDGTTQVLNAGHTPPQIFRAATGEIQRISAHGPALGMMGDFDYSFSDTFRMEPGDTLLVFTDGLTEARPADQPENLLGEDGLAARYAPLARDAQDAQRLTEALVKSVLDFAGGNCEDDMTVVAVRRTQET
ncbi:MAG: SpoIIE family protein phosphatase [Planctomycetes bacterium]|nr:SpoIIE family protein phosphatase [Planctomycetota bacterium]